MHCPKCGEPMETGGPEYRCLPGDMSLASGVERDLVQGFLDPGIQAPPKPWNLGMGGPWYCPRDGAAMSESDGILACPVCQRSLNEYLYRLVELHPHREWSGR